MRVEVAYAQLHEQLILSLDVEEPITVEEAISRSGILKRFTEIDLNENKVGVFGKLCRLDDALKDGDRVEIYRKLIADPKQARRQRAAKAGEK